MANELAIQVNPDNVPGAVTTGYQAQNNSLFILRTGLDTTEPRDHDNGTITVPVGGCIDVNGVIFKVMSPVTLEKPVTTTAYWIAVTDHGGGTASLGLVERPGAWDSARKGCYLPDGRRTLNWVSLGNLANAPTTDAVFSRNSVIRDIDFHMEKGWYFINARSGAGGIVSTAAVMGMNGQAGSGSSAGAGGGGGPATSFLSSQTIYLHDFGTLRVTVGGSGGAGGNGGNGGSHTSGAASAAGSGGGGGGAGAGEATVLRNITLGTYVVDTGVAPAGFPGRRAGNAGDGGSGENPGFPSIRGNSTGAVPGGNGLDATLAGGNGLNGPAGIPSGMDISAVPAGSGSGGGSGWNGHRRNNPDTSAGFISIFRLT